MRLIDCKQLEQFEKETLIELLLRSITRIQELEEEVTSLRAQIEELRGQLAKDSRNSSKPRSSDGLKKAPCDVTEKCLLRFQGCVVCFHTTRPAMELTQCSHLASTQQVLVGIRLFSVSRPTCSGATALVGQIVWLPGADVRAGSPEYACVDSIAPGPWPQIRLRLLPCSPNLRASIDKFTEDIAVDGRRNQEELGFVFHYDLVTGWRETVQDMRQVGTL